MTPLGETPYPPAAQYGVSPDAHAHPSPYRQSRIPEKRSRP